MLTKINFFALFIVSLLVFTKGFSQKTTVIDNKGTIKDAINSRVFEGSTAPANPQTGDIWVDNSIAYDGAKWVSLYKDQTFEKIDFTDNTKPSFVSANGVHGNHSFNVRDASKIVGFTLISSPNNLNSTYGIITGTWMIGAERGKIMCYMESIEDKFQRNIFVTVEINNSTNTITFSHYSSRSWDLSATLPQSGNKRNASNGYSIKEIIIIRNE